MSQNEVLILQICCVIIFAISSIIKLIYWFAAKKESNHITNFILCFFKWYNVYAIYNNDFVDKRDFMKANNNTNKFIWIAALFFAITYFL